MSCLIIRCRSCTPASAVELTDWLENKVANLREGTSGLLVRLTCLAQELPEATVDDGWLIELEIPGERPDGALTSLMLSLEETLRGMRLLGLDPVLLVPVRPPFGGPIPTSAGSFSS